MKKLLASAILILIAVAVMGQYNNKRLVWLDMGLDIGLGTANLTNSNLRDDNNITMQTFNASNAFGANIGLRFPSGLAFFAEGDIARYGQLYNIKHPEKSYSYSKKMKLNGYTAGATIRYLTKLGLYLETGPTFLFLKDASAKYRGNYPDDLYEDQTERYRSFSARVLTGAGMQIFTTVNNRLHINFGFRSIFNATDIMQEVVDAPSLDYSAYYPSYNSPKSTNLIALRLRLEVTYGLGFLKRTTSGQIQMQMF